MTELCSVIRCGVICEADYSGSRIEHADVCGTGMKGGDMKYIIKKLTTTAATVLIVSFLVFLAFSVIPGDPALSRLGTQATPEALSALREEMGLNRPLIVRYGDWLISFVRGDMGESYSYHMPVQSMILEKIPITLTLTVMSFLMMALISVPLGIYCAKHRDQFADRFIYTLNQVIMAVPPFFMGLLITWLFGLIFRLFTPGGYISYTKSVSGFLYYLIFPAVAIALPKCAITAKLLRTSLLDEMKKDYVRTAYSRGNHTNGVLYRHVLKNALIPVVTFMGMALGDMLAGSIIVEQVFKIPGLGRILLTSISNRDYPVVQAVIVLIAAWVIAINCLVDIIYKIVDPRIEE